MVLSEPWQPQPPWRQPLRFVGAVWRKIRKIIPSRDRCNDALIFLPFWPRADEALRHRPLMTTRKHQKTWSKLYTCLLKAFKGWLYHGITELFEMFGRSIHLLQNINNKLLLLQPFRVWLGQNFQISNAKIGDYRIYENKNPTSRRIGAADAAPLGLGVGL